MLELVHTRHNPLVDPALAVWGWEISLYLFLGGLVAGLMVLSGSLMLGRRPPTRIAIVVPLLGLVLLTGGMLALFLDLEHKLSVWRVYTTFQPRSPMSWGSWILVLVYPVLAGSIIVGLRPRVVTRWPWALRAIAFANVVLGAGLGLYTGVLLGTLSARPLWNSAVLGPLFLVSGLSTAAAVVHAISRSHEERATIARADTMFLVAELVILVLFVIGLATGAQPQREAAALVLGGSYTAVFWVLVVGLGLVVPLILQSLALAHRIAHSPAAPVLVIIGGLILRFVIVSAGQASRWGIS